MGRTGKPTHRPHEHGPQVFRRGRWWAADLRPWNPAALGIAQRPTLRDPDHPAWPHEGKRTEFEDVARRWAWQYVDRLRADEHRRQTGRRARAPELGSAIDRYLRHREHTVEFRTWRADTTMLNHLRAWLGEKAPADAADTAELQEWFDDRLAQGYEATTLQRYLYTLYGFYDWLERPEIPKGVVLPNPGQSDARAWSDDEIGALRKAAARLG